MDPDVSLPELRKRVDKAREEQAKRLERKKLNRELFELQNPKVITFKKGFVKGAKALGRGTVATVKGVQKFAVKQQEFERLREEGRRKVRPAIKTAVKKKQKAFRSITKPQKKRRKAPRMSRPDDFGFDSPLGDFGF